MKETQRPSLAQLRAITRERRPCTFVRRNALRILWGALLLIVGLFVSLMRLT